MRGKVFTFKKITGTLKINIFFKECNRQYKIQNTFFQYLFLGPKMAKLFLT